MRDDPVSDILRRLAYLEQQHVAHVKHVKVTDSDANKSRSPGSVPSPMDGVAGVRANHAFTSDGKRVDSTWMRHLQRVVGNHRTHEWSAPGTAGLMVSVGEGGPANTCFIPGFPTTDPGERVPGTPAFTPAGENPDEFRRSIKVIPPSAGNSQCSIKGNIDPLQGAEDNSSSEQHDDPKTEYSTHAHSDRHETVAVTNDPIPPGGVQNSKHEDTWDSARTTRALDHMGAGGQHHKTSENLQTGAVTAHDQTPEKHDKLSQSCKTNTSTQKTHSAALHNIVSKDGLGVMTDPLLGTNNKAKCGGSGSGGAPSMASMAKGGGAGAGSGSQAAKAAHAPINPTPADTPGMVTPPNVELWDRPVCQPEDLISPIPNEVSPPDLTTQPITITNDDGTVTVISTVVDGQVLSVEDAITHHQNTGHQLGTFAATTASPGTPGTEATPTQAPTPAAPATSHASAQQNASSFMSMLSAAQQAFSSLSSMAGGAGQGRKTSQTMNPAMHLIQSLMQGKNTTRTIVPGLHKIMTVAPGASTATVTQQGGTHDVTSDGQQSRTSKKGHSISALGDIARTSSSYSNSAQKSTSMSAGQSMSLSAGKSLGLSAGQSIGMSAPSVSMGSPGGGGLSATPEGASLSSGVSGGPAVDATPDGIAVTGPTVVTGPTLFPAGSQEAPSVAFGDPTLGLYEADEDTLGISKAVRAAGPITTGLETSLSELSGGVGVLASENAVVITVGALPVAEFNGAGMVGLGSAAAQSYGEGPWTPSLEFTGSSVGVTYSTQFGYFIRIGRLVIASAHIVLTNRGGGSGHATISGLPYAAMAPGPLYAGGMNRFANVSSSELRCSLAAGAQILDLMNGTSTLNYGDMGNSSAFALQVIYVAA